MVLECSFCKKQEKYIQYGFQLSGEQRLRSDLRIKSFLKSLWHGSQWRSPSLDLRILPEEMQGLSHSGWYGEGGLK